MSARSENLVTGPPLGSIQTPQPARGSITVDDWDYTLDPIANPTNTGLTRPHRVWMYSVVDTETVLRWNGWCVIGRRADRYTARIDLYGVDYVRLHEEVVIPPLNVSFPEIDPTDNLAPVGSRPTVGERVDTIRHTLDTGEDGLTSATITATVTAAPQQPVFTARTGQRTGRYCVSQPSKLSAGKLLFGWM